MPNIFKAVDCTVTGIKCDNCDYRDDSVPFEDYQKYLNKECPKCKSNLLTQSDFDLCNKIVKYIRMYNIIHTDFSFYSECMAMIPAPIEGENTPTFRQWIEQHFLYVEGSDNKFGKEYFDKYIG
jgi:DNA-directed RNA polymerase subunit RPC12/RpoP